MQKNIIVGISGATGIIYGTALLKSLREQNIKTRLVMTKAALRTRAYETSLTAKQLYNLADEVFSIQAQQTIIDKQTLGMIVAPCAMKTLAEIAWQQSEQLLVKTALALLKRKSPVVLLTRETPLHLGHLRNMQKAAKLGATIFPPMINASQSLDEMVLSTVTQVTDYLIPM